MALLLLLSATASEASNLIRPVAITDWDPDTASKRMDPALLSNLEVAICDDHFPAGSLARTEIERGLELYAGINGVDLAITYVNDTQYVPHKTKSALYGSPPAHVLQVDYVENDPALDPGIHPCHADGDTSCGNWSANACSWDGVGWGPGAAAGLQEAYVISLNTHCFTQDTNPLTTNLNDVFDFNGVSHEMGHVVGLRHAGDRPLTSNVFQTKMIQAIGMISAYDLAFLRHHLPTGWILIANPEHAVSPAVRLERPDGTVETGSFQSHNPDNLYLNGGGEFRSCTDLTRPKYVAQFFDKSHAVAQSDVDVRFTVQAAGAGAPVLEKHRETVLLSTSTEPYQQIDVTSAGLVLTSAELGTPVGAVPLIATVSFEADPDATQFELSEANNSVSMTVNLYSDRSYCPDRPRRLTPSTRYSWDHVGEVVAVSGWRVVSGASAHGYDAAEANFLSNAGAAFVHDLSTPGTPVLEAKLVPTGANARNVDDHFGRAVAIAGTTVAVGAPDHEFNANGNAQLSGAGAVYVFIKANGVWSQEAKLSAPGGIHRNAYDQFGYSVALSSDGNTLAVGAPYHDYDAAGGGLAAEAGAVFIYRRSGGVWTISQKLVGTSAFANGRVAGDLFGTSVAFAPGRLVVGAMTHDYDATGANFVDAAGAVYLFSDDGATLTAQTKLVPSGLNARGAFDWFGAAVAIAQHDDGRYTVVAGAESHDYDATGANLVTWAGAAFVFKSDVAGNVYTQAQKLTGTSGTNHRQPYDYFGRSVAVTEDRIAIGAPGQDYDNNGGGYLLNSGAVYVYEQSGDTTWSLATKHGGAGAGLNGRTDDDFYGASVAVNENVVLSGAEDHEYDDDGAAFLDGSGATFVNFR